MVQIEDLVSVPMIIPWSRPLIFIGGCIIQATVANPQANQTPSMKFWLHAWNALRVGTHTHIHIADKSNFKRPVTCRPKASTHLME